METAKLPEMILMSLSNVYAEMQSLKDLIIEDISNRNNLTEEQAQRLLDGYNKSRQEYQTRIIAQLRVNYDSNLGSVDDMLNNL